MIPSPTEDLILPESSVPGVLVGSTISFIIVGILFIVITLLYTTTIGKQAMGMIREDQILSFLYDNNIIMKIATMLR